MRSLNPARACPWRWAGMPSNCRPTAARWWWPLRRPFRCCRNNLPEGYWQTLQQRFATGPQAALIGIPLGSFKEGYTNSVLGFAPQANELWRYDKHHLVPFGEFIPPLFKWFTQMMNIPLGDFNRGALGQPSFAWAGQRLAANICYEDLFGEELATRFVDAGRGAHHLRQHQQHRLVRRFDRHRPALEHLPHARAGV